jgi:hypothetical protein
MKNLMKKLELTESKAVHKTKKHTHTIHYACTAPARDKKFVPILTNSHGLVRARAWERGGRKDTKCTVAGPAHIVGHVGRARGVRDSRTPLSPACYSFS